MVQTTIAIFAIVAFVAIVVEVVSLVSNRQRHRHDRKMKAMKYRQKRRMKTLDDVHEAGLGDGMSDPAEEIWELEKDRADYQERDGSRTGFDPDREVDDDERQY